MAPGTKNAKGPQVVLSLTPSASPGRDTLLVNGYYCHLRCLPVLLLARARPQVRGRALAG